MLNLDTNFSSRMWMVSEKFLLFSIQLSVQTSLWCSWPFGLELWSCESVFLMFCISCCWCKTKFKFWRSGKHPDNNAIVSVKTKQVINFLPKRCSTMTHFEFWTDKNKKELIIISFWFWGVNKKFFKSNIFIYFTAGDCFFGSIGIWERIICLEASLFPLMPKCGPLMQLLSA